MFLLAESIWAWRQPGEQEAAGCLKRFVHNPPRERGGEANFFYLNQP
jgi:hypothetical protein